MISVAWPATAAEIAAVCGRLDDGVVARILATGATASEVLEAFTWYSADDQIGTELRRHRRGTVGAVYDILVQEELDPDEFRYESQRRSAARRFHARRQKRADCSADALVAINRSASCPLPSPSPARAR